MEGESVGGSGVAVDPVAEPLKVASAGLLGDGAERAGSDYVVHRHSNDTRIGVVTLGRFPVELDVAPLTTDDTV